MRLTLLAAALGMIAVAATAQEPPLAGAWRAVDAEQDGAPAPQLIGHKLSFDGAGFEIVRPDGTMVYQGTFGVDPAAQPAAIDFANTAGLAAGVTWAGIWKRDGATLTIIDNAPDPGKPRPTAFDAPAGSGYVMLVFEPAS